MQEMTAAFSTNLTAMSLLALVVGMFLIYNSSSFTVLQRRALWGSLRVLGTTRRELFWLVLGLAVPLLTSDPVNIYAPPAVQYFLAERFETTTVS